MWKLDDGEKEADYSVQVGSIAKMRKTTKRCNKVKSLLYSNFRGNQATQYGVDNEVKARQQYVADLLVENHSLEVRECGLFISKSVPMVSSQS